jgi:NodT family efflux transporter outer membrane factor (OMF) lipoprotein
VGDDYQLSTPRLGGHWSQADPRKTSDDEPSAEWWSQLDDPVLSELITQARIYNHDINIAIASMYEARAMRNVALASYYPVIGIGGTVARQRLNGDTGNAIELGLDASWELDVFGAVGQQVDAQSARLQASEANILDVMVSVVAEVARNYAELRGLQRKKELVKHNIETLLRIEELAKKQLDSGAVSEFDVSQARAERETAEAQLPNLTAEIQATIFRISVLTGKTPEYHLDTLLISVPPPMVPDVIPVGLPSDMLRRRPDIRRAERELAARYADKNAAISKLFPRFSLTGSVGGDAQRFSDLFTGGGFSSFIAQSFLVPLFEGGRLRASIDAADARKKQALLEYEQVVTRALEEVESSLIRYGKAWETRQQFMVAKSTREEALRIANLRYKSGAEDMSVVLDAQRAQIAVDMSIVESETRIIIQLTQLYKALGGISIPYNEDGISKEIRNKSAIED